MEEEEIGGCVLPFRIVCLKKLEISVPFVTDHLKLINKSKIIQKRGREELGSGSKLYLAASEAPHRNYHLLLCSAISFPPYLKPILEASNSETNSDSALSLPKMGRLFGPFCLLTMGHCLIHVFIYTYIFMFL